METEQGDDPPITEISATAEELTPTDDDVPIQRVTPLDEVVADPNKLALHLRVFGSQAFFRLWIAQVVSSLGDWLGFLAITILAASVGGGSGGTAVGLVMAARIIPGFFLAPVAGVMIDRWDRKKVMVTCDVGRAAVVVMLPLVHSVTGLVLASLVLEVGTLLWSPAKEASVPNIVPTERLTSANSLSLSAAYGTFPVAAVLFAVLAQVSQALSHIDLLHFLHTDQEALAFYVDGATFLVSALVISTLPLHTRRRERNGNSDKRVDFAQTFRELGEGWHFIFVNPIVRAVNLGLAIGLIGGGMVVPLGSIFSKDVLGAGAAGYGLFITALGFGVAAGVITLSLTQGRLSKVSVFELSLLGSGVSLFFAASMSELWQALIGVFVLGICAGAVYVVGFTLLHENVDDELRGRIFSALYTIVRLCLLIAFALGPFLSEFLDRASNHYLDDRTVTLATGNELFLPGVRLTLWLAATIIMITASIVSFSLHRRRVASAH